MMYEQQAILFDSSRIQQVVQAARQALEQGQYPHAAKLLSPLTSRLPAQLAAPALEILGACALAGVGRDWPDLMRRARMGYQLIADTVGAARVRERVAMAHMARGDLNAANKALEEATQEFIDAGDARGQASCLLTQVRLLLRRGSYQAAFKVSHRAVQAFARLQDASGEALSRLARAQVYAALQQQGEAAPDLLWAERLVAAEAARLTRVRLGLARAKVLVDLGHRRRAVAGLLELEPAVQGAAPQRADFARCMGLALVGDDPETARRHLDEARNLHERLGQRYHVVECELGLARAESNLGLTVGARLDALRAYSLDGWPLLMEQWHFVRTMRPRAPKPGVTAIGTAGQVAVKQPSGFVGRLQAAFGWVFSGDVAPEPESSVAEDVSAEMGGTEWGPFTQPANKPQKRQRKKKRQQQEEEQVNYVPSIRSTSLDMRV